MFRVEHDGFDFVRVRRLKIESVRHGERFDDVIIGELAAVIGRLITVKLQCSQARLSGNSFYSVRLLIDEHTDCQHCLRKLLDNLACTLRRDVAWARFVEIETERIRASSDGSDRVVEIRDAADLNKCHI